MTQTTQMFSGDPRLRYTDTGKGLTLLLLHGVTRAHGDWDPLLESVASDYRVIELEHRGHGGSARAESYLVTDYVGDTTRFLKNEIDGPVLIFGHSLGAMVAAAVAVELPNMISGVVMEDPPFHTMGNRIHDTNWQKLFLGMREAVKQGGGVARLAEALAAIELPTAEGSHRTLGQLRSASSIMWSAECLLSLDPEVLTPVIDGCWLNGFGFPEVLRHVRCPALLLQADPTAGGALVDEDASSVIEAMRFGKRIQFPGAGHQLHRDFPQSVRQTLHDFTATLTR